jgi:hypothetical protein
VDVMFELRDAVATLRQIDDQLFHQGLQDTRVVGELLGIDDRENFLAHAF